MESIRHPRPLVPGAPLGGETHVRATTCTPATARASGSAPELAAESRGRAGSRVARLSQPMAGAVLLQLAEKHGVCVHPIVLRRTDNVTGQTETIEVPCGARLASKCKPCAERIRRLRIQQIREGWHLADEPAITPDPPGQDVLALVRLRAHLEFERDVAERNARWDHVADADSGIVEVDHALSESSLRGHLTPKNRHDPGRRTRSTRRRQDAPDLPRLKVEDRTVGKVYAGRAGRTYRPSMLVTLTMGSHGPVHSGSRFRRGALRPCDCGALHGQHDPQLGTPLDPATYDYRSAALDAIHFARVLDRWWQNLRRAAGWRIQYAGAVELQKRLAPHGHFAIRGTLPRRLLRQVAAATYHQVWWPRFDQPTFTVDQPPRWDEARETYVDPDTGDALPSWQGALDAIDADPASTPAYVARLGSIDARGLDAGTRDTERAIRYVTKYLTKDIADHAAAHSDPQHAHHARLHTELSTLPCAPTCANWLLYGVQPDGAKAGLVPGRCSGKVHQRATLAFTGRRVLISRQWSTRTMADVRADNSAWVRAIVADSLNNEDGENPDGSPVQVDPGDGPHRYSFRLARPGEPGVAPLEQRLLRAISARIRWREQLDAAQRAANATGPPDGGGGP